MFARFRYTFLPRTQPAQRMTEYGAAAAATAAAAAATAAAACSSRFQKWNNGTKSARLSSW
jgi:hypothetical protein